MAQQEEGWPLGLQPLNVRAGLARNRDVSGSVSFNTLLTASPSSSAVSSSSDLDTESTGSFFHDRSITLGSLIGISSIIELSRRPTKGRPVEIVKGNKKCKSKTWLFSLCSKLSTDAVSMNTTTSSLGHFLEAERRAANNCKRDHATTLHGTSDFGEVPISEPNSLFVSGEVAPPQQQRSNPNNGVLEHGNECETPSFPLSCLCGQLTHLF